MIDQNGAVERLLKKWRRAAKGRSGTNAYLAGYEDCANELEEAIKKENAVSKAVRHIQEVKGGEVTTGEVSRVHLKL